jgi:hypothetical protein
MISGQSVFSLLFLLVTVWTAAPSSPWTTTISKIENAKSQSGHDLSFADGTKCAALASASFGTEVKIHFANLVPATAQAPEHCEVRGVILPEARFAVKLPTNWNQRFYMDKR